MFSMPYSLLCGLITGLMPPLSATALAKIAFVFSSLGTALMLPLKKRQHGLWPHYPLRAAHHATRIVFSGSLAALSSVLAVWAGRAAYSLFVPVSRGMDALMVWSAIFLGQGLYGLFITRAVRGIFYQYAGTAISIFLFLLLFAF